MLDNAEEAKEDNTHGAEVATGAVGAGANAGVGALAGGAYKRKNIY